MAVTFARFMEKALYGAEHGYYRSGREKFGARGDYYTSVQVHPAFARLLVRRFVQIWEQMGRGEFTLLELGAGRGDFAREAQQWAERRWPEFHRALRYVAADYGDALPDRVRGCVFSNEFFDAQPVHVLRNAGGRLREMYVKQDGERFVWEEGELSSPALEPWLERLAIHLDEGDTVEISLAAAEWIARISALLDSGWVVAVDYGYRVPELARFPQGTLMSYRRHAASDDVLQSPAERDLTAHVNWDLLIQAAHDAGLDFVRLVSQGSYLMELGEKEQFEEVYAECKSELDRVKANLLLKNLVFGMGETMQVLELKK